MTDDTPQTPDADTEPSADDPSEASARTNDGPIARDIDAYADQIAAQIANRMAARSPEFALVDDAPAPALSDTSLGNSVNTVADRVTALLNVDLVGSVDPSTTDSGRGVWWYDLNGLRVTANPDEHLVGPRIDGMGYRGLSTLADAPRHRVPNVLTEYIPASLPGGVNPIDDAASYIEDGIPYALEGEAGTGKNTLFDMLHGKTNRPLRRSSLGLDTSIFQLSNERDVIAGTTVNNLGDLTMSAVFGGTWLGDEINMVEGDVTSQIHGATEEPGKRTIEIHGTDRVLVDLPEDEEWDPDEHLGSFIHPEFRVTATMNPLSYGSTNEMNNAFRGRFTTRELTYVTEREEAGLLAEKTGVDTDTALQVVRLASELREMYENNRLLCPISPRQLRNVLTYYEKHRTKPGDDNGRERISLADAAEAELRGYAQLPEDKTAIVDAINDEFN